MWTPRVHADFPPPFRRAVLTMLMGTRRAESLLYLLGSMGKETPLAVPQVGSGASSGRAWQLGLSRHFEGEARPLRAPPLPRVLELAASKVADSTAFDPPGSTRSSSTSS